MWGRRESGRAVMLAATEPQVIRQMRVMGHRWRTQPRHDSEIESDLVASAKLHTTTTTQGQGEVGEAREWGGTDVGGDRTTGDPATEGEGHQWRRQPRQDSKIETDLVASATGNHITSSNTDATQYVPPLPSTTPQRLPVQLRQRHTNTDTNNGGTRSPMQQQ